MKKYRSLWKSSPRLAAGAAFVLIAAAIAVAYAEIKLSRLVLGGLGESFSTRVYGAPTLVNDQTHQSPEQLMERLRRLKYRPVADSSAAPGAAPVNPRNAEQSLSPGDYAWNPPVLTVSLRGFTSPPARQEPALVSLKAASDNQWTIRDSSGGAVAQVAVEPEMLAELSGVQKVRRAPMLAEDIPQDLANAVIAAEDKRFFAHWGIDWRAVVRAAWHDIVRRNGLYGGSTITQQLVKNIFLTPRRTFLRKIAEAFLSVYIELRMSKGRILTLYLNHIYMGQDGPTSVAGMKAAADFYFGKNPSKLSLSECAVLAGLIRSPHLYNPLRYPAAAKSRRDAVLKRMFLDGMIDQRRFSQALVTPIKTRAGVSSDQPDETAYVIAEVDRELLPRYGEDVLYRYGLGIYTTIDPLLQNAAQAATRGSSHQAALVALNPWTGAVLALAGGKEFKESQFNRATQALRQPGSAFKPFVYGAALEKGFTPATLLEDRPRIFKGGPDRKKWNPENYDRVYRGSVPLRQALALSLNAATLDLAGRIGTQAVIDFARKCGIASPLDPSLALALGDSEVTLWELTAAYSPFANGGFAVEPRLIDAVTDAEGNVQEYRALDRKPVMSPAEAYLVASLLRSVVEEGTGKPLAQWGWTRPSAGKTGTTNQGKDAWFVGFTPQIVAGAWVGDDRSKAIGVFGAKDALPLWASFMQYALRDFPPAPFAKPNGLVDAAVDPQSGLLARSGCPVRRQELFLPGTQPTQSCPLHPGGIKGWFQRIFGKNEPRK